MASGALSFKYPAVNPMVSGNQESHIFVTPMNASTAQSYTSNGSSSIIFNFASNSQFMRTNQTYLSFTCVPKDAAGTALSAGVTSSLQGISRAFSRLIVRIGATEIENLVIDDLTALHYSTLNPANARMLTLTEGFNNPNVFNSPTPKKFGMQILSSLFSTPQAIPLPLITAGGGLTVELILAPVSNLFTSNNVASFEIQNPRIMTTMITPPPEFTVGLVSAVKNGGKSAYLPYTRVRQYRSNGNASNTQMLVLPVGNVRSVEAHTTVMWDESAYAVRGNDKFSRFTSANLIDYRVEGAGLVAPNSLTFSGVGSEPEFLLNTFIQETGSIYNLGESVYLGDNFNTQNFRVSQTYTSDNEVHGSGLSLLGAASPNITITTTHSTPVPSTVTFNTFVSTAALLEITSSYVNITEVF
jgi:hypothetical protein